MSNQKLSVSVTETNGDSKELLFRDEISEVYRFGEIVSRLAVADGGDKFLTEARNGNSLLAFSTEQDPRAIIREVLNEPASKPRAKRSKKAEVTTPVAE